MKILITSKTYPGIIGVSTYIEQLLQGLRLHSHHVDFFLHNPFLKNSNSNYRRKTNNHYLANYQAAASHLPFDQYDIVHSQGIIPTVAVSRILPNHIPLVNSLHGALTFNTLINGGLRKNTPSWQQSLALESRAVSSSDICIVGSKWLKNVLLQDYKVPETQQFSIIPYGLNIEEFMKKMQMPPSIFKPIDKFVIACTARLVPLKGHKYLLDALAKLKRHRQDWVCWLIGDGPLRNQLKQQANKLGLQDYIKFLGNQNNIAALLNQVDLFVFPSLQDNFPYGVMEAQIAGVPVIATDAGGIPEMVHNGTSGLISPKYNSDSLFKNMNTLIENANLREVLANNAKSWAMEYWSQERMITNTIAVYQQALQMKNV